MRARNVQDYTSLYELIDFRPSNTRLSGRWITQDLIVSNEAISHSMMQRSTLSDDDPRVEDVVRCTQRLLPVYTYISHSDDNLVRYRSMSVALAHVPISNMGPNRSKWFFHGKTSSELTRCQQCLSLVNVLVEQRRTPRRARVTTEFPS